MPYMIISVTNSKIMSIWNETASYYEIAVTDFQAGMTILAVGTVIIFILAILSIIRTKLRNSSSDLHAI